MSILPYSVLKFENGLIDRNVWTFSWGTYGDFFTGSIDGTLRYYKGKILNKDSMEDDNNNNNNYLPQTKPSYISESFQVSIVNIIYSSKNKICYVLYQDSYLRSFDFNDMNNIHIKEYDLGFSAFSFALNSTEDIIYIGSRSGKVEIRSLIENLKIIDTIKIDLKYTSRISFVKYYLINNDELLTIGTINGLVFLYNLTTKKIIKQFHQHTNQISSIQYSVQNNLLISSSYDKQIIINDLNIDTSSLSSSNNSNLSNSHHPNLIINCPSLILSLDLSTNEEFLLYGLCNGEIKLLNLFNMKEINLKNESINMIDKSTTSINCVSFDPFFEENSNQIIRYAACNEEGLVEIYQA